MTGEAGRDESAAAQGARWITVSFTLMGLLNYAYALVLTRLLDVAGYSAFVAGQGLILWATTVAAVSVPWVLAQSMVRARSAAETGAAVRFAMLAAAGSGIIAAIVVGLVAARFADAPAAVAVALSTLVIFLGTTATGRLQGQQRMRTLSALFVGENVLKNVAGLLLVTLAGLGQTGALAGFGIGGLVMLAWWPRGRHITRGPWLTALANRDLWRRTLRFTAVEGLVSLFVVMDVVLVALLPGDRAAAASYQASAALSRAGLFIASAMAMAFFPLLSRRRTGGMLSAEALRMYAAVAVPVCLVMMTTPASLLAVVFPAKYAAMAGLLKFTAMAGLAAGGISLISALFQATNDFACLPWLCGGLAGYVAALLAGWRIGGITGLAAGAALGAGGTLTLLGYRLLRREGRTPFTRVPVAEPLVVAGVLVLLRPHLLLWLAGAALIGLRSGMRFFRPARRLQRPDGGLPAEPAAPREARPAGRGGPGVNGWHRTVVISSFDRPENPHYKGGGAAVVETIARWLAADYDVTVVTAARGGGTAVVDGVRYRYLPVGWAGPRGGQLLFHAVLPFAARRIRHDLWIESFTPPFSTSFLPLFSRARVVGFAQSLCGEQMWRRYRIPFFLVERLGLRLYRQVVALNSADGARIRRYSPSAAVQVIPNCVDLPPVDEPRPGRGRHILFLGRIDTREKGLDLLLAAYKRSELSLPLLLAGAGTRREERRLAALLATTRGDVRWLGHVTGEQKQELLDGSAFMVLPSRCEAFGLAALEGMARGKPVLHFDLPSLRWMHGDVRVPPFDVGALAGQMRRLAADEAARGRLGRAAQAGAQRYGRAQTAARYLALVRRLLDGTDPGPPPARPHRARVRGGPEAEGRAGSRARAAGAAAVGAVALLIRLALHGRSFDLFGDEVIYTGVGRGVINGGFPRFGGSLFFLHGPGFFYLEAGWARLLGGQHGLIAWVYEMRTLNAVLAGATAMVVVLLAARAGSLRAGLAAGLLFALDPFCIRQNDRVLLETGMVLWVLLGYLAFTSPIVTSASPGRRSPRPGAVARAAGAGLLFGLAVLTKDEAVLLTVLPLLAAAALRWSPGRPLIMLAAGATVLPYLVYLTVVAANGHLTALWASKTSGIERLVGLIQVTGFHSHAGGSLPGRLLAEGAYFATTYLVLALAIPAAALVLRRGGPPGRMLGLLYCSAAAALGYGLILGTLEEQELYLLIVPSLLVVPLAASLWRAASPARTGPAAPVHRGLPLAGALVLVLGVNLVTSVQWLRQPDDGVARLLSYLEANVPAHTRITAAAGEGIAGYALAGRYDVGTWPPPVTGSRPPIGYVVVPWAEVNGGYSDVTAAQVRHLVGHGRLVFSFRGRSYGDLALYHLPARAEP